jgi:hypothetical protein
MERLEKKKKQGLVSCLYRAARRTALSLSLPLSTHLIHSFHTIRPAAAVAAARARRAA